jgi:hypothetical protein
MRPPLLVNDMPWPEPTQRPQRCEWAEMPRPLVKDRIFDHLTDSTKDEDRHFSRVARWMQTSTHWLTPSPWLEPAPVSGEFTTDSKGTR